MLIVEGADLVGKTTLCQKLVKALAHRGYVYSHFTRLPDEFHRVWGYIGRMSNRVVQDRFHMSEVAYAEMRGDPHPRRLLPEMYRQVDARLRLLGAYTVVLVANADAIRKRYTHPEMYDVENCVKVNGLFQQLGYNVWGDYHVDVDVCYNCGDGYLDDKFVSAIANNYLERQMATERILHARPTIL